MFCFVSFGLDRFVSVRFGSARLGLAQLHSTVPCPRINFVFSPQTDIIPTNYVTHVNVKLWMQKHFQRRKNMALHICLTGQWTHHVESLTLFCLWRQTFSVQLCTCYISQMKCFIVSDDDDETIDSRLCDCFLFNSIARHILGSSGGFFAMFANSKSVCMPKNAFQCWLCVRCALFLEEWLCTKSIKSL